MKFRGEGSKDVLDLLKITFVVGSDSDLAMGFEGAEKLFNVFGADEAAFVVFFFRPGVGEIDVVEIDAGVGEEIGDECYGVGSYETDVAEAAAACAVNGIAVES